MKKPFIERTKTKGLTKAQVKALYPHARYSGKTLVDKDGNVERKPGFYID